MEDHHPAPTFFIKNSLPRRRLWVSCDGTTGCHDRKYAPGTWARCSDDALTRQRARHGYHVAAIGFLLLKIECVRTHSH